MIWWKRTCRVCRRRYLVTLPPCADPWVHWLVCQGETMAHWWWSDKQWHQDFMPDALPDASTPINLGVGLALKYIVYIPQWLGLHPSGLILRLWFNNDNNDNNDNNQKISFGYGSSTKTDRNFTSLINNIFYSNRKRSDNQAKHYYSKNDNTYWYIPWYNWSSYPFHLLVDDISHSGEQNASQVDEECNPH